MSKAYTGLTTNGVTELTLQEEGVGNIGTQTIVWDSTQGTIDQVIGAIPDIWKQSDSSLKQLQIGTSCTSIGSRAFYYCTGLTGSLTIPDSVTSIGSSAFSRCNSLTGSLTIGNSVTSIGSSAFEYCTGLTGSLTIPDSVTSIGDTAFYNCSSLTGSLIIPDSVTTIGSDAFGFCTGLTGSLTIPDSVTSIGGAAFFNCSGLTGSLVIPESVTSIGDIVFMFCSGLTAIYVNCPASSWVGSNALNATTALVYIYYGPDTNGGAGYNATFQQGSGMTVSAWTNYPNIP